MMGGDVVYSAHLADINDDGPLDVVYLLGDGTIKYHLGLGDGQFAGGVDMSYTIGSGIMFATTLDNDGLVDVVTASYSELQIMLGNGMGTFGQSALANLDADVTAMVLAPFDGDQDLDVISASGSIIRLDLNNGAGVLLPPFTNDTGGVPITALGIGDFTSDGLPDVAIGRSTGIVVRPGGGNAILFNGVFNPMIDANIQALDVGDIDGDQKPDIAYVDRFANNVGWVRGFGGGAFLQPDSTTLTGGPATIDVHDIDGDGNDDLVVGTLDQRVMFYLSDGAGGMAEPVEVPISAPAELLFVDGDVNDDGVPDVVVTSTNMERVFVLLSTP
jgi:hypothetical protein